MTLVLVMILAALIALFIAVTVGLVNVQRRPRGDRRRRRRRAHLPAGEEATHRWIGRGLPQVSRRGGRAIGAGAGKRRACRSSRSAARTTRRWLAGCTFHFRDAAGLL